MRTEFKLPDADAPPGERRFGDGPFPAELDRFNLGACLVVPWWPIAQRLWGVVLIGLVLTLVGVVAFQVLGGLHPLLGWVASMPFLVGVLALRLFVGRQGSRLAWEAMGRSLAADGLRRRVTVRAFVRHQRWWLVVAVAYNVWAVAINAYTASGRRPLGVDLPPPWTRWVDAAILWLFLAIAIVWWYRDRQRASPLA